MSECESPSKASATSHNMPLRVNLDYLTGSLVKSKIKTEEDVKSSKDEPLVQLSDIDMTRKPRQLLLTAG